MNFPLTFSDVSLWLAVAAIILLTATELLFSSPEYSSRILIDKKRLTLASVGCGLAFLVTVIMRVMTPF
jgi:hypothetical protein